MLFGFTTSKTGEPAPAAERHATGDPRHTALLLAGLLLLTAVLILVVLAM